MKYRKIKKRERRKGGNKGWDLERLFFSPVYFFISPLYFLFLFTSFIFDRGHVTDLLRYVFFNLTFLQLKILSILFVSFLSRQSLIFAYRKINGIKNLLWGGGHQVPVPKRGQLCPDEQFWSQKMPSSWLKDHQ